MMGQSCPEQSTDTDLTADEYPPWLTYHDTDHAGQVWTGLGMSGC